MPGREPKVLVFRCFLLLLRAKERLQEAARPLRYKSWYIHILYNMENYSISYYIIIYIYIIIYSYYHIVSYSIYPVGSACEKPHHQPIMVVLMCFDSVRTAQLKMHTQMCCWDCDPSALWCGIPLYWKWQGRTERIALDTDPIWSWCVLRQDLSLTFLEWGWDCKYVTSAGIDAAARAAFAGAKTWIAAASQCCSQMFTAHSL